MRRLAPAHPAGERGELTQQVPYEVIDAVLEETRRVQCRVRVLPARALSNAAGRVPILRSCKRGCTCLGIASTWPVRRPWEMSRAVFVDDEPSSNSSKIPPLFRSDPWADRVRASMNRYAAHTRLGNTAGGSAGDRGDGMRLADRHGKLGDCIVANPGGRTIRVIDDHVARVIDDRPPEQLA